MRKLIILSSILILFLLSVGMFASEKTAYGGSDEAVVAKITEDARAYTAQKKSLSVSEEVAILPNAQVQVASQEDVSALVAHERNKGPARQMVSSEVVSDNGVVLAILSVPDLVTSKSAAPGDNLAVVNLMIT